MTIQILQETIKVITNEESQGLKELKYFGWDKVHDMPYMFGNLEKAYTCGCNLEDLSCEYKDLAIQS